MFQGLKPLPWKPVHHPEILKGFATCPETPKAAGDTKGYTPHVLLRHEGCKTWNEYGFGYHTWQTADVLIIVLHYLLSPNSWLSSSSISTRHGKVLCVMDWRLVQGMSLPPTQCMLGETPTIFNDVPVSLVILTSPHQLHPLVLSIHWIHLKCCHISLWRDICQKSI